MSVPAISQQRYQRSTCSLQLTSKSDCITTPNVVRVKISDSDVLRLCQKCKRSLYRSSYLNNDVLDTVGHAKTLALDNTLVTLTNQTLVGVDSDTDHAGLVVSQGRNLLLVRTRIAENKVDFATNLGCRGH